MLNVLCVQLASCYTSAQLQYNENLQTTTVVLESFLNPECQQFQDEINLTVTFYNDWAPITFIQPRFNYSSFSQVVMTQTVIKSTPAALESLPTFAELNISNLAYWTLVRVVFLGRQVAQMDRCFDQSRSQFEVQLTNFSFVLGLTPACLEEIRVHSLEFQYQFNMKAGTVQIIRTGVGQNCEILDTSLRCWNYDDYLDDVQQPFTTPLIKFFIPQDDVIYSTEIVFEKVVIGRVGGFFENCQAQFFLDNYYIQFDITKNETIQAIFADNIGDFTKIIYRITAEIGTTVIMLQFVQTYYDPFQRILSQKCYDQECIDNLKLIRTNLDTARLYLDLVSYTEMNMNIIVGSPVEQIVACFRRQVTTITSKNSFCVQLEQAGMFSISPFCNRMTNNMTVDALFYSKDTTNLSQKDKINAVKTVQFDFQNPIVCFESDDDAAIQELRHEGVLGIMTLSGKGFQFIVAGYQICSGEYNLVYYIVFTIAGILITLCLVDTIIKLIVLVNILKASKKSRKL
ncbi:hypothetical protein SS50377_21457 [Spironucleus salmonicida]|uniref:Transmembrane protein n=1 Tax=Spironucleus salmonicida TaxID=348837 RepID=V6LFD9_9EUKA|nr:hypothetical protein SS50377_21457 [Spironucleus salmonicida]|eukprot:EST42421.1 Hypothetical protein SS50377_17977 [Spironucleus salmonicida]